MGELSVTLEALRAGGHRIGVVPTMGALHEGHRSLLRRAAQECDAVVVTIFVNPLQFGDSKDLATYPRTLQDDLHLCQREEVSLVFAPPLEEMYPEGPEAMLTQVSVRQLAAAWEGAARPGHFDGVATVVAKLFAMCGPAKAYFGEKDFQQLAVVRRMAADLSFPVEVVGCPTVREPDGLARSSRNVRLSRPGRAAASVLHRALAAGSQAVRAAASDPAAVASVMAQVVGEEPLAALDYAAVVDPGDLTTPERLTPGGTWRLLVAATIDSVHLIDNVGATSPAPADPRAPRPALAGGGAKKGAS